MIPVLSTRGKGQQGQRVASTPCIVELRLVGLSARKNHKPATSQKIELECIEVRLITNLPRKRF